MYTKDMITLRNFTELDAEAVQKLCYKNMSLDDIKEMFSQWDEMEYEGRYFEMFAIVNDQKIVGQISLYQHSESVISFGPEIYDPFGEKGLLPKPWLRHWILQREEVTK